MQPQTPRNALVAIFKAFWRRNQKTQEVVGTSEI
jgi:hypothetical protein